MQIKLFTIPTIGGEAATEEMNRFLRSHKILQVDSQLTQQGDNVNWCFCIRYIDKPVSEKKASRIDYKEVLDEQSFQRFAYMREIRKELAKEEAVPAYAIFTNEELAALARIEELTLAKMKKVKGIGAKKIEKYATHFITTKTHEESNPSDSPD